MPLDPGARLGPYEVLGLIGAGGMGQVYKARDTRLLRTVAIKILSSREPHRGERFLRETRALSRLSHPHVCSIHDVGEHDGSAFLVMEYLEGPTLAERLDQGALPLPEALRYAVDIADAVAEAHRQGLIHRDLKPSNVMLTREGAKVLDFGLAKLVGPDAGGTESLDLTAEGDVVGTVAYMSPEQLEGRPLDERTDLFALGTVLFEMVTARRAFAGESRARVIAAVLTEDPPPLKSLQPLASPALERVVARCLAKDPDDRWHSARDLASELRWILEGGTAAAPPKVTAPWGGRLLIGAALAGALVAAGGLLALRGERSPDPTFERVTFRRGHVLSARFAPDGRTIVYGAAWDGKPPELFSARQGSTESRLLGYPLARVASISPSGEMALLVGVVGEDTLSRVPLAGGAPRELMESVLAADWMPDDSGLAVLRTKRAQFQRRTFVIEFPMGRTLLESSTPLWSVRVSPKGDQLAVSGLVDEETGVFVVDRSGARTTLSRGWASISGTAWSPRGDEVWFTGSRKTGRDGSHALWAVTLSGRERLVARAPIHYRLNDVFQDGRVLLSASDSRAGILCQPAGETKERELGWLPYSWIEDLSADGRTLLFAAGQTGGLPPGSAPGVYLRNADGAPAVRLGDGHPLRLSPDGRWVLAKRADSRRWFLLPTRAGMPRELPPGSIGELAAGDWLDDRRIVLWGREDVPGHRWNVYVQDVQTGTLTPVTPEGVYPSEHGLVTPDRTRVLVKRDGKWLLYPVDGTEPRPIAPLDATDEPVQWSADGRALYVLHRGAPSLEAVAIVQRVDTVTGERTPVKTLSPPDAAGVGPIERVAITPDGRSYCYTYSQMLASLYVAEGLR